VIKYNQVDLTVTTLLCRGKSGLLEQGDG